jgi:hypothetical protein
VNPIEPFTTKRRAAMNNNALRVPILNVRFGFKPPELGYWYTTTYASYKIGIVIFAPHG